MGEVNTFIQSIPLNISLFLSTIVLFGCFGSIAPKNAIIILGCVELMLNSVNLLLAAFSAYKGNGDGQLLVFFIMVVAAAEVAVGLAIIAMLYRNTRSVDVSIFNKLRG
jgi:NADH-quinone oxidoreductase subunit K